MFIFIYLSLKCICQQKFYTIEFVKIEAFKFVTYVILAEDGTVEVLVDVSKVS